MKKIRIMPFILLLLAFFPLLKPDAAESPRNIYVGDIIELKISSGELTGKEIREKFSDFEIVGLIERRDHFIIRLRTFETGEKRVVLGDKEIVVAVRSTLQEIGQEGPIEGGAGPASRGPSVPWLYIFIASLVLLIIAGVFLMKDRFKKKSRTRLTPYQLFLNRSNEVSYEDKEFFVKQTICFKEYIEAVYNCKIKNMTTSEILYTVAKLPHMSEIRAELERWLRECDFFKFTGNTASMEKKQEMRKKLAELVGRIDAANKAAQETANRNMQAKTQASAMPGTAQGNVPVTGARGMEQKDVSVTGARGTAQRSVPQNTENATQAGAGHKDGIGKGAGSSGS